MGLLIHNIGTAVVKTLIAITFYLHNVLYVPIITKNLLSVSKLLADSNVLIEFYDNICFVKAKNTGIILLKLIATGGLYQVCSDSSLPSYVFMSSFSKVSVQFNKLSSVNVCSVEFTWHYYSTSSMLVNSLQFNKNGLMAYVIVSN